MQDQPKSLTAQQREALQLARRILARQPNRYREPPSVLTLSMALRDILDAFAAELGDSEEGGAQ